MKERPLGIRFGLLAVLLVLAAVFLAVRPIRKGMDLEGGHSLVFKVDTGGDSQVLGQVIETLKERVDPQGIKSLTWRPAGDDRLEVRMPAGSESARAAKAEYLKALEALGEYNLSPGAIRRIVSAPSERRAALIDRQVGADSPRGRLLAEAAGLYERMTAEMARIAEPLKVLQDELAPLRRQGAAAMAEAEEIQQKIDALRGAHDELRGQYGQTLSALREHNLNTRELSGTLTSLYVSPAMKRDMKPADVRDRAAMLAERLAEFKVRYAPVAGQIDAVEARYRQWADVRGRLDDPEDLIRLIRRAGVLEFRIAPVIGRTIAEQQAAIHVEQLARGGPQPGRDRKDPFQWFPLRPGKQELSPGLVTGDWGGKSFLLLSDQRGSRMVRAKDDRPWDLDEAWPGVDYAHGGRPQVNFRFAPNGKAIFAELTGAHVGEPMAILLDDEAYSAPVIQTRIVGDGVITGDFTSADVGELVRTLNAGRLRARVNPDPVAVHSVGPTLGAANIVAGQRAAYIGLLVVAVFMAGYYLLSGALADFALAMNLFLSLAAMAAFEVILTLPGIAGLILTIGMAVDANVLIFERLREEQDRGVPIKSAIRNAYQRAFSAIFDGNLTTVITCVILAWVGTQEIRGFGITLAIGLSISMFTALSVTRWSFELLTRVGVLKGKLPMLRLIGVPKVNWFAKRKAFWVLSTVLIGAGLTALVSQGRNVLGIEFRQGSRATVRLNDDALIDGKLPTDQKVADTIRKTIDDHLADASADAQQARARDGQQAQAEAQETLDLYAALARETFEVNELRTETRVEDFIAAYDARVVAGDGDDAVSRQEWDAKGRSDQAFALLDVDGDGRLTPAELAERLPEPRYQITSSESEHQKVTRLIATAFRDQLTTQRSLAGKYELIRGGTLSELDIAIGPAGFHQVTEADAAVGGSFSELLQDNAGAAMMALRLTDASEAMTVGELHQRLRTARLQPTRENLDVVRTEILPFKAVAGTDRHAEFAVLVHNADLPTGERRQEAWTEFARGELELLEDALTTSKVFESLTSIDPAQSAEATSRAAVAIVLSWVAMIVYLWIRFGRAVWGVAAVICLVHDTLVTLGAVALSAYLASTVVGRTLMIEPFKIDLAMIAAVLTIIGYSVNDTIVIFDRIRENRGKLRHVTVENINASVNQTLGRTLLTSGTVLMVVVVMYIFGGAGIHGFNYAMIVGVLCGSYSTIAIASPLLMGFKTLLADKAVALGRQQAPAAAPPEVPSGQ